MLRQSAVMLAAACLAAGCASAPATPLATGPDLHADLAALRADTSGLGLEPLKPLVINIADGIDPQEAAVLAVLNNADLAAKRTARGVAAAQAFAAGLLPDPQISVSFDHPTAGPDNLNAYNIAPSLDLGALIARAAQRKAAEATKRQGELDLLWAEWDVAQQARAHAETALAAKARQAQLRDQLAALTDRAALTARAAIVGDATRQTAVADLAARLDARAAMLAAQDDEAKARAALNALLNLDASVELPLKPGPSPTDYDRAVVAKALADLPTRRPDLIALRAGYEAQDANVRVAVLNRFPLNQVGVAFARDTAGSVTEGVAAAFALPIFNGGRGQVAIQSATRDQLRAEYQARLDQAASEVQAAEVTLGLARAKADVLAGALPAAEQALAPARFAYDRGDLDGQAWLGLLQAVQSKRADLADARLQARLAELQIENLLFLPPAPGGADHVSR